MSRLTLGILGPFQAAVDGEPLTNFRTKKAQALLVYLASEDALQGSAPVRRETVLGLLWADYGEQSARQSLRTNLSYLRKSLAGMEPDESDGTPLLLADNQTIQLNPAIAYDLDVADFTRLLRESATHDHDTLDTCRACLEKLQQAAALYRDDFLCDFYLPDSASFEEWAAARRAEFKRQVLEALDTLTLAAMQSNEPEPAERYARRQLAIDNLRESAQRQLMTILALGGQRSQALVQYDQLKQLLADELGAEPTAETEALHQRLLSGEPLEASGPTEPMIGRPPRVVGPCPYRGLAAFREEDTPFFFGREVLVQQLAEAVGKRALVHVIVGSSGCGKSSVVYAGLLPRLRADGHWLIAQARPGSQPFQATAAALLSLLEPDLSETARLIETQKLGQALRQGDITLESVTRRVVEKDGAAGRLLLLIDQFEELYTLCPDDGLRRHYLDQLLAAVASSGQQRTPPLVFLLTLRADFMGQALSHRPFADTLQDAAFMIGPMNAEELQLAIEKPAEIQGAAFEEGLVERILKDVGQEPGHLPLLEFALTLLWEKQKDGWLTHADYEEIGQVEGALAGYADQVMAELTQNEREQARQIFVQLVRPGQGTEDTRRVATRSELGDEQWSLVRHLADRRLVVTGREEGSDQETAEVVHEALIQRWGQLRGWMAEDRVFRTWQERLRAGLQSWQASGEDEGALLRGGPLAEAEEWLAERGEQMSAAEREYIEASIALRQRREQEREAQRQRELETAQKLAETERERATAEQRRAEEQTESAGRLRRSARYLAGALLIAAVLAVIAFLASQRASRSAETAATREIEAVSEAQIRATAQADAEEQRAIAEERRQEALRQASIGLAAQALAEVDAGEQDRAVLLALEALENYPYTSQAESALARVVEAYIPQNMIFHQGESSAKDCYDVAWSPDGRLIAAGTPDRLLIGDVASMAVLQRIPVEAGTGQVCTVTELHWSPGGDWLLALPTELNESDEDYCPPPTVWEVQSGEIVFTLSGHEAKETSADWSPDGSGIVTVDAEGKAKLWDAWTGAEQFTLAATDAIYEPQERLWESGFGLVRDVSFSPDGVRFATAGEDGMVRIWGGTAGRELLAFSASIEAVVGLGWSPDGEQLGTASADGLARIWDSVEGGLQFTLPMNDTRLVALSWSPDGRYMVTRGEETRLWHASSGTPLFDLPAGPYWSRAAWSPAGEQLATTEEEVTVWDLSRKLFRLSGHTDGLWGAEWSSDGSYVASAGYDGTARIWDAATGQELRRFEHENVSFYLDLSPDGKRIATTAYLAPLRIWDVGSGDLQLEIPIPQENSSVARPSWSPDGSLIFGSVYNYAGWQLFGVLYDAATGEALYTLRTEEACWLDAAWSPSGDRFVTSCWVTEAENPPARVWDAASGEELMRLEADAGGPYSVDWSPDGQYIVVGYADGTARIWGANTGKVVLTFAGHALDDPLYSVRYSPDGGRVASGSMSGSIKVWDAVTAEETLSFESSGIIRTLSWSPDGAYLLAADQAANDPVIRRAWQSTEQLIAYAYKCCVIRELTPQEREQFGLPER